MTTQTKQPDRQLKGTLIGVVVSDKRNKSRSVEVAYQYRHPKYGKYLNRSTRYQVHDEENTSKLGDRVEIAQCRPMSRTKNFRLLRVVEAALAPVDKVVTEGIEQA